MSSLTKAAGNHTLLTLTPVWIIFGLLGVKILSNVDMCFFDVWGKLVYSSETHKNLRISHVYTRITQHTVKTQSTHFLTFASNFN